MRRILGVLCLVLGIWWVCPAVGEIIAVSPGGMSLTEALTLAHDGDEIELAEGVYAEPAEIFPLTVSQAVTICAAQDAHAVISAPAFKAAFRVEADGVSFRKLDVQFNRTGFFALGNDMTIDECNIALADTQWRTSSCGIWMGGIYRATIKDCSFTDCGIAIAGPPLSETSHLVPVLTGLFEVGEDVAFFTTHTIQGCAVNGKPLFYAANMDKAIAPSKVGQVIIANCNQAVVEDADVSHASMGMQIMYCDDVQVARCKADYCGVFGIYLAKNRGGTVVASGCEGTNHGIDIRASHNINVVDCYANACDQGIFFSKVDYALVKNCTVTATDQGYFFAGGNHNQMDGCTAKECENGFNIQKENDMLITRCILTGCTICGARLDSSPTTFVDNMLANNWVAVMAYGDVSFVLADNTITDSGACGLYLRDVAYSRISGNIITGSSKDSMQAIGEMSGTILSGNSLDVMYKLTDGAELREQDRIILPEK